MKKKIEIKSDLPFDSNLRINPIHNYIDSEIKKLKEFGEEVIDSEKISKIRLYLDSLCKYPFPSKDFLENSIFFKRPKIDGEYLGVFRHNDHVEVSYIDLRGEIINTMMFTKDSLSLEESRINKKIEKIKQKELEEKHFKKVVENSFETQQIIREIKVSSPETHSLTDLELIEVASNRKFIKDLWEKTDLKTFGFYLFKKLNKAFCLEKLLINSNFELVDFSNSLQLKKRSKGISWECGNIWLKHKKCGRVFKLTPQNRSFFVYKNCKSCTCVSKDEMRLKSIYHDVGGFIDNYQDKIIVSTWGHYYNPKRKGSSIDNYVKFRTGREVFIEVQGSQHIENQTHSEILKQVRDDYDKLSTINKLYPRATMVFIFNTDNLIKLNEILSGETGSKEDIKKMLSKIYNPSNWKNINVKFIDLDEFECSFLNDKEKALRNFYNLLTE